MFLIGNMVYRHSRPNSRPNKTAIIYNDVKLTYKELNDKANQLANGLISLGLKRGDRVGYLLENSWEFVVSYFAVAKIGAILVPISFWYKAPEVSYVVNRSGISCLILGEKFVDLINAVKEELIPIKNYILIGEINSPGMISFDNLIASSSTDEPQVEIDENDPHLILFTSGTTGFPKGAVISHRSYFLFPGQLNQQFGINENDIYMNVYPLFHMGGIMSILITAYSGGTLVLIDTPPATDKILDAIQTYKVTSFTAVPTLWKRLLEYPTFDQYDLSSLRIAMGGSDAMPKDLLEQVLTRTSATSPTTYGLTEGSVLTYLLPEDSRRKIGSAGKVHFQSEIKLLYEDGTEVAQGEVGEIVCRCDTVMSYYWDDPEETNKALRDGWLYTGDLGRFDEEGYLYIVGRKKDMIISGGQNIYPAEIERVLNKNPKIKEAVIIGVPHEEWGETVLALVVVEENETMIEEEVVNYVKDNLASYNKPRYVRFVNAIPRTAATGKIQKGELRKKYTLELSGLS